MAVLFTELTFRRFALGKSESFASFAPQFRMVFFKSTYTHVVRSSLISNSQESNDNLDIVPMFRNIYARSAAA